MSVGLFAVAFLGVALPSVINSVCKSAVINCVCYSVIQMKKYEFIKVSKMSYCCSWITLLGIYLYFCCLIYYCSFSLNMTLNSCFIILCFLLSNVTLIH